MVTYPIAADLEEELEGTPELEALRAKRAHKLNEKYPKPDPAEILSARDDLLSDFTTFHSNIEDRRDVRYLKDTTPKRWQKSLQDGRRFYTRMTHNEILRVVGLLTDVPPRVRIPAMSSNDKDVNRATQQTRFANQIFPALERRARRSLLREVVDASAGDGVGILELYLTGSYDDLDLEQGEGETPSQYMKRTEEQLQQSSLPFAARSIDPLSVVWDEDEDGPCQAWISERRARKLVAKEMAKRGKEMPPTSDLRRQPSQRGQGEVTSDSVDCVRYYDRRWYAYFVDDQLVELEEHGMPGLPVFFCPGIVTASPRISERFQGVAWGMETLEKGLNDLLTLELDTAFRFGRPKVAIETAVNGQTFALAEGQVDKPYVLDLSGDGAVELRPGQKLVDAYAGFRPAANTHIQQMFLSFWQRSGLSPVAQGESPGSDVAGYTVNSLQQAATRQYEVFSKHLSMFVGQVVDMVRLTIRDTIRERVYFSIPMEDQKRGGPHWLSLGPKDIDEVPSLVSVPNEQRRLAVRQSLSQGNKEGFVPRGIVQTEAFGAEDPDEWDDLLIMDEMKKQLAGMAIEEAKLRLRMVQPGTPPPGGGPGAPPQPGMSPENAMVAVGGAAAPAQPPTIGPMNATNGQRPMSTRPGPPAMQASAATAGEDRGYRGVPR